MWIRSQDKETLINVNKIKIRNNGGTRIGTDELELAEYSTKEKAMKVLDMIQEALTPTLYASGDIPQCDIIPTSIITNQQAEIKEINFVFQMPQDDEVK